MTRNPQIPAIQKTTFANFIPASERSMRLRFYRMKASVEYLSKRVSFLCREIKKWYPAQHLGKERVHESIPQNEKISSMAYGVFRSGDGPGSLRARANTFSGAARSREERREIGDRRSGQLEGCGQSPLRGSSA